MFFNGWEGILRVLIVGFLAYSILVFMLRVTGKRTLSKMNAFDLVVTVAIGSMLANIILAEEVALAEGAVGMGLLILLQYLITWLTVRVPRFAKLIKAQPALLFHRGQYLNEVLKRERVLEAEVQAAVRAQGKASMEDVLAVVLETDGSFTVISTNSDGTSSALTTIRTPDRIKFEANQD